MLITKALLNVQQFNKYKQKNSILSLIHIYKFYLECI